MAGCDNAGWQYGIRCNAGWQDGSMAGCDNAGWQDAIMR